MKKLLSLPPNLVGCFHEVTGYDRKEWFCSHDPVGRKLGSGGGTAWLLEECFRKETGDRRKETGGRRDLRALVVSRETLAASCWWPESSPACLCAFGKDPYPHSRVPLGTGTTVVAGSVIIADPFIPTYL